MTRKCTRCCIEMNKKGTVHLMKGNIGTVSIQALAFVCPNCKQIELVEVEP